MKKSVLFLCFMIFAAPVFSQDDIELTGNDKEIIAHELDKESQSGEHDKKTKKLLKKVASVFKSSAQNGDGEVKRGSKLARKLGKGASWLTTTTAKPFMNVSGFLTGVFEKREKNKDVQALYQFFLNHSKDFDLLYMESGTPEELVELILGKMTEIMEKKSRTIMQDFLYHIGIKRQLPEDLMDFELTIEEVESIDESKIDVAFINNHPEYLEVKPIIGEMTKEEMMEIVMYGNFDKDIGFENYMAAMPKIHEGVTTIVAQIFAPKIVLGILSKTLAGLYALPVLAADVATGVSAAICLKDETQEKFSNDKDLRAFCGYVVNRSGYELMKSRAKGYVAGKKTRAKIEDKIQKRKARREERRKAKGLH